MATSSVSTPVSPADDLERFAYVASHDMAEPLRIISGYLELIRDTYGSQLDADFDDFMLGAMDGAERMHSYLVSLRTYSRIGRLESERERVELTHLVEEALTRLAPEVEASGAQVTVCSLPAVMCERGQMTLVFESLLSNAIKFGRQSSPNVELTCDLRPEGVEIAIADDGIGIEPADEARVFAMLERLNGRQYAGTGMGLPIARKAIERHGGAIWYEPGRAGGSVFRFSLPYLQTAG